MNADRGRNRLDNRLPSHYVGSLTAALQATEVSDGEGNALTLDDGAHRVWAMLGAVRAAARKVMLIGNGGSAALVSHAHNDLCKAVGVRAMVFNEVPLLTALANDLDYSCVFERPAELWAEAGDMIVVVSSSGRSENILRGARAAVGRGARAVTFSGFKPDNPLRKMGEVNFYVPSGSYGFVEVAHMALLHCLTDGMRASVAAQAGGSGEV